MFEFNTIEEAEKISNEMFKLKYPSGTTELLYGWELINGKYVLSNVEEKFKIENGMLTFE